MPKPCKTFGDLKAFTGSTELQASKLPRVFKAFKASKVYRSKMFKTPRASISEIMEPLRISPSVCKSECFLQTHSRTRRNAEVGTHWEFWVTTFRLGVLVVG